MAVPEQTPYKEYTANGNTTSFALGFICDSKNDLIVLVDNVAPPVATWSLVGNNAVFTTAPASGKKIVLQRNTAMSRTTNYQGNNNSFRPETINKDIDRVWLKLQELGVADMLLKIYVDRLHGEQKDYIDNKDQLVRNIITDLRNYVNQQDGSLSSDINNLRTHVNQQDNSLAQSISILRNHTDQLHNNQKNYIDQQDNQRNSYFENLISRQGVSLQQLDSYYNYLMQRIAQIAVDKGWDASFVVDGDKTQKQINANQNTINNANVVMIDLFASVAAALDWVKSGVDNYLYVKAGTTYTLPSGTVYFNRIVCLSGQATFKVPATTVLNYINKTDGSEVVHLEKLNIFFEGHRGDVNARDIESQLFPYSQGNTAIKSSTLKDLDIRALTDINNIDSWSDDVGQSRGVGFITLLVNESSTIENIKHYGLAVFATIKSNNINAVHYERNVVGYNNETNIYNPVSTFKTGESSNIKIFNTVAQKAYWLRKNVGALTNGKNCVMCESDHTDSHLIENCGGKNIIERSVYNTSRSTVMRNTLDEDSATCAAIKHTKTTTPSGEARGSDLRAYNITNTSAILDVYGFQKYELKDVHIENEIKIPARAIYFTNIGEAVLKGGFLKNLGMPFYLTGSQNIGSVDISDYEIINCNNAAEGSLWWQRSDATNTLQKLTMSNITYKIENIAVTDLANVGAAFEGVVSVRLNNVECISRRSPFVKGAATTYIEALDCNFRVVSDVTHLNMWTGLGGTQAPYANKFDYTVSLESTTATPQVSIKAKFKKLNDSGLVKCHDYWSDIDFNYPVTVANGLNLLTIGDKSFKCIASFDQAQIEFVWDAVAQAITTQYNIGAVFSTTLTSDKINIYVDSSNRFTINIGNGAWSGGAGNLSVKISRF